MKKRLVAAVLGGMLVMTGCGSDAAPASTVATSTNEAAEAASEAASADETAAEAGAEAGTEAAEGDGFIDDEMVMGEETAPDANGKISNGFMSITMPKDLEGTYVAYTMDGEINIYDKESKDAGFGGFVFGVCVTDDYAQYGGMRKKIGELKDKDGQLYHVLLALPSDVQWDYTKSEEMPATYKAISDRDREIAATLEPDQGGEYVDGGGTKGEEIYGDLLKEIVNDIQNAKDSNELEEKNLSPVYYAMTQGANPQDPMKDIGVSYTDFNLDGVDEMVLCEIENGQVYDIFGSVDGKPAHVISGNWRDYFKVYGSVIAEYTTEGAGVSIISVYDLLPNSTELFPQYSIKLDETDGAEFKWSVSYEEDKWEELSEEDYKQRLSNIEFTSEDEKAEYTALGNLK